MGNTEYYKKWYKQNGDLVKRKARKKEICECGAMLSHGNMSRHRKLQKHISTMQELEKRNRKK